MAEKKRSKSKSPQKDKCPKTGHFLKGNKAAFGALNSGRCRTVCPPDDVLIELGEEMIEWCIKNNPTHLSEWFSIEKGILWATWDLMQDKAVFAPYYEKAISIVAANCRNGILDKSLAQRFLSLYHRDLKKADRQEKEFEHNLKKAENVNLSEEEVVKFNALMTQLSSMQKDKQEES